MTTTEDNHLSLGPGVEKQNVRREIIASEKLCFRSDYNRRNDYFGNLRMFVLPWS